MHPLADQALRSTRQNSRHETLLGQQLIGESGGRDFGLHHQMHADAPAVENDGFLCSDPFDRFAIPRGSSNR